LQNPIALMMTMTMMMMMMTCCDHAPRHHAQQSKLRTHSGTVTTLRSPRRHAARALNTPSLSMLGDSSADDATRPSVCPFVAVHLSAPASAIQPAPPMPLMLLMQLLLLLLLLRLGVACLTQDHVVGLRKTAIRLQSR